MKAHLLKRYLLIFLSFYPVIGYSQNAMLDSQKMVLQTQKEDSNGVKALNDLCRSYTNQELFTDALRMGQMALALAKKIKFKRGERDAYINIAKAYTLQKNNTHAIENYLHAVSVCEEIDDLPAMTSIYQNLSTLYKPSSYPEAMKYEFKRLRIFEELNDTSGIADCYEEIGFLYRVMNNYPEAEKYLFAALRLSEKTRDKNARRAVYNRIAQLYRATGNYSGALQKDSAAYLIAKETGNRWNIAWSLASIGSSMEGIYAKERPNEELGIRTAGYKEALKNYYAALKIFTTILNDDGSYPIMSMYNNIGNVNIRLHNLKESRYYLEKTLQLATKSNNIEMLGKSYKGLSTLDSIQGNYKQAYTYYRKYLVYNDSQVNNEGQQTVLLYKMQYESEKNDMIAQVEQSKKEAEARRSRNIQFSVIAVLFLLAIFFFISNRQKQKAKAKIEQAYDELKSTQQQLIQSEKMASLGELTAGIAHEIQNPLNFVNNFSEVSNELLDEMKSDLATGNWQQATSIVDDLKQNLEKINHHGKRADAIVKGMLQHSRSSSGQKEPTDINALAEEYLRLAYHGLRAKDTTFNATMRTDFQANLGTIPIIPQDIGRVILNLITNAFYAVTEKKKKLGAGYEPAVTVSTKKEQGKIMISVEDNGNGILQGIMDKIFQPFFTTKPTGQGTGLGLSLSYDIMKAHGGDLNVKTKEGEGSEFIIQLPVK